MGAASPTSDDVSMCSVLTSSNTLEPWIKNAIATKPSGARGKVKAEVKTEEV